MAKGFYIRTMTAGRYQKVVRYSRTIPGDNKATRQAKQVATTAAQKFINVKNATEKLQLLLCANFDRKDACFCTFTFTDENLPANQKHTQRIFSDYIRKLRIEFRRNGKPLLYIYTVEGTPTAQEPGALPIGGQPWEVAPWRDSDRWEQMDHTQPQEAQEKPVRLHVHCFLLLKKEEYETVRALWVYGQVYINQMKVNELTTFQRLAAYVTKEKRSGDKGNGVRSYVPSANLQQPEYSGHWCTEFEGIVLPSGAEKISSGYEEQSVYGASMEFLYFRLPRPQAQPQPYKSKGLIRSTPPEKVSK